ncbi:(deoxy)nucleoside triphosphate pyrophosphohydrolase [Echinicola sp. CAU 1574]|uniref:8-oxo-dGTP diphosphatase n=1 Tax=Echinicola arenosa TaxID=2774144 RepID=A0ABR9AK51_9BACT|nr:(deoxy)nucleoside triphosphate pyrophosphohydrolase [Echinicola arenosa]MBD8488919.1 (deoxy)nucleoside triphosphate pyrophosphohydrolase [Echinicola arenosa]
MLKVTCAIIVHDGMVLAVQRSKKMKMPLKWEFPGGKLENGESERECLIREIKEELHLDIKTGEKLPEVIHQYPNFKICLIPFIASIQSGELHLAEHQAYQWLPKEKLLNLDWAEADVPVVEDFLKTL